MKTEKELFDEWFEKRFGDLRAKHAHAILTLEIVRDGMFLAWKAGGISVYERIEEWKMFRDSEFCRSLEKEEEENY